MTFTAKAGGLLLLMNNQKDLTISPELTSKGSFVVVISKEKIQGGGGKIVKGNFVSSHHLFKDH